MEYYDKKHECMNRKALEKLQLKRLKKLVFYVYQNCKFYREKMQKLGLKPNCIKTLKDIEKLPFTEKTDLRANYPFNTFSAKMEDIVRLHASSGTTGKLTVVGCTQNDLDTWSRLVARGLVSVGIDKTDIIQVAYGYGLFTGGLGLHYGAEKLGLSVIPASSGNTKRQVELFKDFGTTVLCSTPSYACFLADELENQKIKKSEIALKKGVFGAEFWSESMCKRIEKSLGIDAYDIYGLSEIMGPGVACECEKKAGLHLQEDHFLAEIVDTQTLKPLCSGQKGELVLTTLTKEGMPLIRYRTHDLTSICKEKCSCGRTTARLSKITGRTDDMLIIRGVNVYPSQVESALSHFEDKLSGKFQIVVDRVNDLDTMEVVVELSKQGDALNEKEKQILNKKIFDNVKSMITTSAKITLASYGTFAHSSEKFKLVDDKRKI